MTIEDIDPNEEQQNESINMVDNVFKGNETSDNSQDPELQNIEDLEERFETLRGRPLALDGYGESSGTARSRHKSKKRRRESFSSSSESEEESSHRPRKTAMSKAIEFAPFGEYGKEDEYREFRDWIAIVQASMRLTVGWTESMKADYFKIKCGRHLTSMIATHDLNPVGSDYKFTELIENITEFLKSKRDPALDYQALVTCVQREDETVERYLYRLKQLIRYKDVEPEFLAKQFPHGLRDKKFKEDAITQGWSVKTIVESANRRETLLAQEAEEAKRRVTSTHEVALIRNQWEGSFRENKSSKRRGSGRRPFKPADRNSSQTTTACPNCGIQNHFEGRCPAKGKSCMKCGKLGHFKAVCRSFRERPSARREEQPSVNQVNEEDETYE